MLPFEWIDSLLRRPLRKIIDGGVFDLFVRARGGLARASEASIRAVASLRSLLHHRTGIDDVRLPAILKVVVHNKRSRRQFGAAFTTKFVVVRVLVSTLWTDHQCRFQT